MRRNFMARAITTAATLALLTTSAVSAQFDDAFQPALFPDVQTAIIFNATGEPNANETIGATARSAHKKIGGRTGGKRNGYFDSTLPETRDVVLAALDFAKLNNNLVIVSGGDSQAMMGFVGNYPNTTFIDIGQPLPCVDGDGGPDRTGACVGGEFAVSPNYTAVSFEVEAPAFLAGVVAASASRDDRIGIISGLAECEECNRYIQGFTLGAQSIKPEIDIELAYLADDNETQAFTDNTAAKTFAGAFIDVHQPDVLLPIANGASIGMIEAACDAGIMAIGTGIDVASIHPELAECVLTSITKDLETAVRDSIYDFSSGSFLRLRSMTLADGTVDLTEEWRTSSQLPVGVVDRYESARDALITGQVDACPVDCGQPPSTNPTDATEEEPITTEGESDGDTADGG
jgi:basic membrane lipoprotein Med (substrate-binding protein (PBP1-ABC) superfamily)